MLKKYMFLSLFTIVFSSYCMQNPNKKGGKIADQDAQEANIIIECESCGRRMMTRRQLKYHIRNNHMMIRQSSQPRDEN